MRHPALIRALLAAVLIGVAAPAPAQLLQQFGPFIWRPDAPTILRLDGDVAAGAAEAFSAALAVHHELDTIVLNGGGESLEDAMAIARIVHDRGLATRVDHGAYCRLACAVIFLAGVERQANGILVVGLLFPAATDIANTQIGAAELLELLISFGLSDKLIAAMMSTGAGGTFGFSPHEVARFGVDAPILDPPPGYDAVPYGVLHEQPAEDTPLEAPWPSHSAVATWNVAGTGAEAVVDLVVDVATLGLRFSARFAVEPGAATLTINAEVAVPVDFAGGGIVDVPLFRPRPREVSSGNGWIVAAEPDGTGVYRFAVEEDAVSRAFVGTLLRRDWMSFILVYANDQVAELLFEVGPEGRAALDAALTEWGL